ncbi:MAG TPA: TonB-dependent receptor [Steroidobacteraceae bacterium]|nr:TonB-dependent receptor [Steroidobacteraceae bacterium]
MNRKHLCACALTMCCAARSYAQGVVTDSYLDSITVTATQEASIRTQVNPIATKSAEDLLAENLVNPEDALRYVPNLTIRKRYIGDRNALIGGRSFSTLQAPRGLVFVDGYLLSNFLGRFDAPRWNIVAPEEIERVDVLYGPYSAIYPGNSIGTTVVIKTRRPDAFQASVRTTSFAERFDEYGYENDYSGYQASAFIGNRVGEKGWFSLAANREDATGHPMQYFTISADAQGRYPNATGTPTQVSGIRFDIDPQGRKRAVFGASAGAIDHAIQNQLKLRGGYEISDDLAIDAFIARWHNDSESEDRTFVRDLNGQAVWSGVVQQDGMIFKIPDTALAPNTREETHMQWGTTLQTTRAQGWNGSLVYSEYRIREDDSLQANSPDPLAMYGGPGTNTKRDGTGWQTFETQLSYAPNENDWTHGDHTLAFGYHQNTYQLRNPVFDLSDWRVPSGSLSQNVYGDTRLQALYVQDQWQLSDRWSVTSGVRLERWAAFNGGQSAGTADITYADRHKNGTSPKLSIAYLANERTTVRLSFGRGIRFPTVAELFQGTTTATSITVNDPHLQPEVSDSVDLTADRMWSVGRARVSLFQDDVRDSIYAQTNITVTPSVTNVQNVGRVRTRGIETAFTLDRFWFDTLSLNGSIAYARSKILENDNYPISVGNEWPRIPHWRGHLQAQWRPDAEWIASLGVRYSGRMYNRLENDDIHPDTYGGVSRFTFIDARVAYTFPNALELAIGVDNLTNQHAYQAHPYPGRTGLLEARWSFGERR